MNKYICLNCRKVFHAGASYAKCCGVIEEFSPKKHAELLIGSSNSWIDIWEKWRDHPKFKEISDKLSEEGSFGAATAMNVFIEKLLRE